MTLSDPHPGFQGKILAARRIILTESYILFGWI